MRVIFRRRFLSYTGTTNKKSEKKSLKNGKVEPTGLQTFYFYFLFSVTHPRNVFILRALKKIHKRIKVHKLLGHPTIQKLLACGWKIHPEALKKSHQTRTLPIAPIILSRLFLAIPIYPNRFLYNFFCTGFLPYFSQHDILVREIFNWILGDISVVFTYQHSLKFEHVDKTIRQRFMYYRFPKTYSISQIFQKFAISISTLL